jgi:hypothetical protein
MLGYPKELFINFIRQRGEAGFAGVAELVVGQLAVL